MSGFKCGLVVYRRDSATPWTIDTFCNGQKQPLKNDHKAIFFPCVLSLIHSWVFAIVSDNC